MEKIRLDKKFCLREKDLIYNCELENDKLVLSCKDEYFDYDGKREYSDLYDLIYQKKDKYYLEKILPIYYKYLMSIINNGYYEEKKANHSFNKAKAILFYEVIRDTLENYLKKEKLDYYVSLSNCFIKGNGIEYDMLIVKTDNQKMFYEEDEVVATVELKGSGFYRSVDDFPEYIKGQKVVGIPHIYISLWESSSFYEECIKNNKGIYCVILSTGQRRTFVVPEKEDYDLFGVIDKICKKNK